MTLLTAATVHKSTLDGFFSGRLVSLRVVASPRSPTIFQTSRKRFLKCSTSTRNTVHHIASRQVSWRRFGHKPKPILKQQKVESTARAHEMPVQLPAGSWGNLMKTFQDQYGSSIPPKEFPAQSYFETLEEMVQDRVFFAESLAQVVSLDTENKTSACEPRHPSPQCQMISKVSGPSTKSLRMMKLRSPGRAVLCWVD